MYEIIYDYEDEKNIRETFEGDWTALQEYITKMKEMDATILMPQAFIRGLNQRSKNVLTPPPAANVIMTIRRTRRAWVFTLSPEIQPGERYNGSAEREDSPRFRYSICC